MESQYSCRPTTLPRQGPATRSVVHFGRGSGAETLALGNDGEYRGFTLDLHLADLVSACCIHVRMYVCLGVRV